jgi:TRF2-interacting telomeric protein/Rap1 - C terminal domain/Rap1 Myb domain
MSTAVIYEGVERQRPNPDALFAGRKFWFSSTVPQKVRFIEDVRANGGEVVLLEKQADVCLYDHARKNPPPGMYSYRYIELSIRNGQLEDLEAHRIGGVSSRAARPVGSVVLASKGSRNAFTEAEDQMLWDWVKPFEGMRGSSGNVLFQQLEAANPSHTFQSWRDRWLKYVQFQKRDLASKDGQKTDNAAPVVDQSTTTRAPHTGANSATASPQMGAEVPVQESPRRKRGRPPKTKQQGGSNHDTITVDSVATAKQQQRTEKVTRQEIFDEAQPEKVPLTRPENNTGSWEFSDAERELLLNAVEVILHVPESKAGISWDRMAEGYPAHTAQQWRSYFEGVIVPLHRAQQRKRDAGDMEEESGRGDESNSQANSAQGFQEAQSNDIHLDRAERNRHRDNSATMREAHHYRRSLSFHPQSPRGWKAENDGHHPGPNEPRKEVLAKSNSQESAGSQYVDIASDSEQPLSRKSLRELHTTDYISEVGSRPTKRRKLPRAEVKVLEIPSTPEHTQGSETIEDLPGAPTPRARNRLGHDYEGPFSPLFLPFDSAEEEELLPRTLEEQSEEKENVDPETRTSPISVHLVSDRDAAITPSSPAPIRDAERESTGSPTPEFETAPDFSQIDVDPSEQEEPEEFETAAEEPAVQKVSKLDTQALFAAMTQHAGDSSDLGLPEPEGGWDAVDQGFVRGGDEAEAGASPTSPASSTASTLGLDLDAWISLRVAEGRDVSLLLAATEATNMHKKLADTVYASLASGNGVPKDARGVWTKKDDELLMGTDARGIKRVQEKHGKRSVDERFECLGLWNG